MIDIFGIKITGDSSDGEKALARFGSSVDGVSRKVFDLSGVIGALGGALTITAFAGFIKSSIDAQDELSKLAQKTGTAVDALAGLKFAAEQNDASLDVLARGSQKLATVMASKPDVFRQIGITATDSVGAMIQLADIFAAMPDGVEKTALASRTFGEDLGSRMIPFLNNGTAALNELIEKGKQYNPVTTESAAAAARFNDGLAELQASSATLGVSVANELLPTLNEMIGAYNDLSVGGDSVIDVGRGIGFVFESIVIAGANVSYVFSSIGREIGGIVAQFSALGEGGGIFSKEGRESWSRVGEEMKRDAEDARKSLDAFTDRILNADERLKQLRANAGKPGQGAGDDAARAASAANGKKLLGSFVDPEALKRAAAEAEALRKKDIDGWVKYAEALQQASDEETQALADMMVKANEEAARAELEWTRALAQRTLSIQEANLTDEEVQRAHLLQVQNDLQLSLQANLITEQQYHALLEQETLKHQAKLGNIEAQGALERQKWDQMTAREKTKTVLGQMLALTNGVATQNKELFEINKAAGIANAIVNAYEGISLTLSKYPYPFNIGLAALHAASAFAQVQAISSAQFGSSTSAPSIGGGSATPVTVVDSSTSTGASAGALQAPNAAVQPRQQINLNFQGSGRYTYEEVVNGIIPLINQAGDNGADITVTRG